MTIEQTLVTMAAPILTGGLHPNVAPQNGAHPYGVYTHLVSPTQNTLSDSVPIQQDSRRSGVQIALMTKLDEGAKEVKQVTSLM